MSTFCNAAGLNVFLPCLICHDQDDFWVTAENFQRSIRTRVIVRYDRIYLLADVIQSVLENKGLIAEPRASDQKVLLIQQRCVARDDPLTAAELPIACPRYDHWYNSN